MISSKHKRVEIGQRASIRYSLAVLENSREVSRRPWKKNLILDQGLNAVAARPWVDNILQAVVGTGTTPTRRDSGAITFTRSGTTVTASAGFFAADDVGRLIKFDSGEEMYVVSFTDTQNVEVDQTGALGASEGTVWYVDEVGHAAESKRTATYGIDSGDNGSTFLVDTWTFKRTYIFSAQAAPAVFNEIGWSHDAAAGNNLFGRDLISGGISLSIGQQLKVVLELSVTLSPAASTAWTTPITGWTQDGATSAEMCALKTIAPQSPADSQSQDHEPGIAGPRRCGLSSATTALAAMNPAGQLITLGSMLGDVSVPNSAYVAGNFFREYSGTFAVGAGNSAAIRSIMIGAELAGANPRSALRVLLAAAETKDSDHTLTLTFRMTWDRVLTN